jgi:hypothetical protein
VINGEDAVKRLIIYWGCKTVYSVALLLANQSLHIVRSANVDALNCNDMNWGVGGISNGRD